MLYTTTVSMTSDRGLQIQRSAVSNGPIWLQWIQTMPNSEVSLHT